MEGYSPDQIANLFNYVNNPYANAITNGNSCLSSPTVPLFQLQEPYPQFSCGGVSTEASDRLVYLSRDAGRVPEEPLQGFADIRDLHLGEVDGRFFGARRQHDWLGSFTSLQDPNKPWLERSLSTFDIPQQFQVSYTWQLPIGRKQLIGHMPGGPTRLSVAGIRTGNGAPPKGGR